MTCRVKWMGVAETALYGSIEACFVAVASVKSAPHGQKKERAARMDSSLMERGFRVTVYSRGVDAFLQECAHRLLKKVRPESCHELVSSEIECRK